MAPTLGEAFENLRDMVDTYRPYAVAYNETLEKLKKNEVRISKNICNLPVPINKYTGGKK